MKNLFNVTAVNHDNRIVVMYDSVYDICHLWDGKHDTLRLMIWNGEHSPARREFINMNENDILIYTVRESV